MAGYTTTGVVRRRRSVSGVAWHREALSHFKTGAYAETDPYLFDYGLWAEKERWVLWGPQGPLEHVRVGRWQGGAYSHYASGALSTLLAAYSDLTPPGFILAQPKIVNVEDADADERFVLRGTLLPGGAEERTFTVPEGTYSAPVFLGGLKLAVDGATTPFTGMWWYTDVPSVTRPDDLQGKESPVSFDVVWDAPFLVNHRLGVAVRNQAASAEQVQLGTGPRNPQLSQAFTSNIYLVYDRNGNIERLIKRDPLSSGPDEAEDQWEGPATICADGLSARPQLLHMHDGRTVFMRVRGGALVEAVSTQEGAGAVETE